MTIYLAYLATNLSKAHVKKPLIQKSGVKKSHFTSIKAKTKVILSPSIARLGMMMFLCTLTACQKHTDAAAKLNTDVNPVITANSTQPLAIGKMNWQTSGFEQPESIVFDSSSASSPSYFVSNISGKPTELNGKGFISRVAADGKMINKHWITGLNAPKGMAQLGNLLFVADMQQLHIIDIAKASLIYTITEPSSQMLNDISIDAQGNVYVGDLLGGGVYKLANNKINSVLNATPNTQSLPVNNLQLEKWILTNQLPLTNGLFVDGNRLLVATWGKDMQADFSTKELGGLYAVDINTKAITPLTNAQKIGNLDGIFKLGEHIIVNDWINGKVFDYYDGNTSVLFMAEKTSADISTDGTNLLVPVMMQNKIISYTLE